MSFDQDDGPRKTIINKPLDWSGDYHLSESAKSVRFAKDDEGNLKGQAVMMILPNTGDYSNDGGKIGVPAVMATNKDAVAGSSGNSLAVGAETFYMRPGATDYWERARTPTIFQTSASNTTNFTAWNPAAGKKFRLMGGLITISKEAACAGAFYITFNDNATPFLNIQVSQVALVATGNVIIIPISLPANGYLSLVVDNDLNINFSAALTAGSIAASLWGTEE